MADMVPSAEAERPSLAATILAAMLPLPFHVVAVALLALMMGGTQELLLTADAAGPMGMGSLGAGFLIALVNTVLLALLVRGKQIPPIIPLVIAAAPWLLGLAVVWSGASEASQVIPIVIPADRATVAAGTINQGLYVRAFGAWLGGAQLAAVGLGLGIAAMTRRADCRGPFGAAMALLPAASNVCVLLAAPMLVRSPAFVILPVVVATIVMVLGGLGAGDDSGGRSGALATTGAFAAVLAIGAASAAVVASNLAGIIISITNVNPNDKGRVLVAATVEVVQGEAYLRTGTWIALAGAAGLAVWALLRGPRARSGLPSLALSAALAIGLIAGDSAVVDASSRMLAASADGAPGLKLPRLVVFDGIGEMPRDVDGVLQPDGTMSFHGAGQLAPGAPGLAERLQAAINARSGPEQRRTRVLPRLTDAERISLAVAEGTSVAVFADAARALQAAGVVSVDLIGAAGGQAFSPADLDTAADVFPFVHDLVVSRTWVHLYLANAVPRLNEWDPSGEALPAPPPWTAEVRGGTDPLRVSRVDPPAHFDLPMTPGPREHGWDSGLPRPSRLEQVHLAAGDGAGVHELLTAAARLTALEYTPVYLPDGLPPPVAAPATP